MNSIAQSQPHAAFSAFTHGLSSKWTYFLRTIPNVKNYLQPLEDTIRYQLLPTLTGQCAFNDELRTLISLPSRLGGLGILNPLSTADSQFNSSLFITGPLVSSIILSSNESISTILANISQRKAVVRKNRRLQLSTLAQELYSVSPSSLQRCLDVAGEKGASTWLTALPLSIHGFALNKGAFRDALCLRYGWIPSRLPSHCVCGNTFTVDHCFNCKCGGFPSIRHNEVRDITAHLFSEVCHDVLIEPQLQELSGEALSYGSANRQDQARVDVAASGFWGSFHERAYFDVRIYNPFARTYVNSSLSSCYKRNESEKRRNYDQRIREIEHGSFTPLVFSTAGGMGPAATVVFKRLASMISIRNNQPYSRVLNWLRCRLGFSLIRSAIMCLRGARSSYHHPIKSDCAAIDLALSESKVHN